MEGFLMKGVEFGVSERLLRKIGSLTINSRPAGSKKLSGAKIYGGFG